MKVLDFISAVTNIAKSKNSVYLYGFFGQVVSVDLIASKARQYPTVWTDSYISKAKTFLGKYAYDCTGLIKAVLMGGKYNEDLDLSARGFIDHCKTRYVMTSKPNPEPGALLYKRGSGNIDHVGIYIGSNMTVQAKGINYGLVIEPLGATAWEQWGLIPEVDYMMSTPIPEHWADQHFANLVNRGVIRNDDASRIWKEYNRSVDALTIGQLLALVDKATK